MSIDRSRGKKADEPAKDLEKAEKKDTSSGKPHKEEQRSPRMKTVKPEKSAIDVAEEDGSILKQNADIEKKKSRRNLMLPRLGMPANEIGIDDDSSDEDQKLIKKNMENKFRADVITYDTEDAERKKLEKHKSRRETLGDDSKNEEVKKPRADLSKLFEKSPKTPPSTPRSATLSSAPRLTVRQSPEDSADNSSLTAPVSPRNRLSNAPKFFRDISQRMSWVSGDQASDATSTQPRTTMTTDMTNELIEAQWDFVAKKGLPDFTEIPEQVLNDMADIAYKIRNSKTFREKTSQDQQVYMRRELGRRFIGSLVAHAGDDFDNDILGSTRKMRSYLKENYGILIHAPSAKRKSMIISESNSSNSSKSPAREVDFLDHLQKNVEARMNNYQIDLVFDLKNSPDNDFIEKLTAEQFVNNFGSEKVDDANAKRLDVSKTFIRDFPNSTYLFEDDQGVQRKISSVDDFVKLIGDPQKNGLPYLVSHFCNQNLPIFLRNLFFSRTSEDGSPVSVLRLHDGTPMSIAMSPSATYIFKKSPDGGIFLKYEGKVDATGTAKLGRNAAYLLKKVWNEEKQEDEIIRTPAVIEGATATWSQEITFKADGLWELKNPRIQAKGWNRLTS